MYLTMGFSFVLFWLVYLTPVAIMFWEIFLQG